MKYISNLIIISLLIIAHLTSCKTGKEDCEKIALTIEYDIADLTVLYASNEAKHRSKINDLIYIHNSLVAMRMDTLSDEVLKISSLKIDSLFLNINQPDSIKNQFSNLFSKKDAIDNCSLISSSNALVYLLNKEYLEARFIFEKLEPHVEYFEENGERKIKIHLNVAQDKLIPIVYFGHRDTIKLNTFYGYKNSKFNEDHFTQTVKVPSQMTDSIFGIYQIPVGIGAGTLVKFGLKINKE